MSALLTMEAVTLRRGGRLLFENFDLRLGRSEALHLNGPNGSGKSSLIRLAAGLLKPDRGSVQRESAAFADDALALDHELTLRRALSFWGGDVDQGLQAMGLIELQDIPVRMLSSGQARRASLARVIAAGAPLWLLDEPLNTLDAASIERLDRAIKRHLEAGGAVVAASHVPLAGTWRMLEFGA